MINYIDNYKIEFIHNLMSSIGQVLTGVEFNDIYKVPLYKFLNNNFEHYGIKYKLGLNIDINKFNPTGECLPGGLYFCEESECHRYFMDYGQFIATIEIPDDAQVYVEKYKFKADKFIIKEIMKFENISNDFWIKLITELWLCIKIVKNQTDESVN